MSEGVDPVVEFKLELMRQIRERIRTSFSSSSDAAKYLGVLPQAVTPVSTLKHSRYSIEWLIRLAGKLGIEVVCTVKTGDLP